MHFLTDEELINIAFTGKTFVFDIEVFRNFVFFVFKEVGAENYVVFVCDENNPLDVGKLGWFILQHRIVGFNSWNFDLLILTYALTNPNPASIKQVSDQIIIDNLRNFDFQRKFGLELPKVNHIDLMEVCPLKGGLKLYGARLHAQKIQDIPIKPEQFLTEEEKIKVGNYCLNDLQLTELIFNELEEQIALRERMSEQYEVDLRSKSDAQIAERVITAELFKRTGTKASKPLIPAGTAFKYRVPDWMMFQTPELQRLLADVREADFVVSAKGGCGLPTTLEGREVRIGRGIYRLGIGGLHSSEKCQAVVCEYDGVHPGDHYKELVDRDVASYYPSIILNQGLYPEHLGPEFLEVYHSIVQRRLEAKKAKHSDADSLKIVINGSFGKFSSKYSPLYSPQLGIQVTMTGQLALLMLIEAAEMAGHQVVSANTDGTVFHVLMGEQKAHLDALIAGWEAHTGFDTEETIYKALYSRDVNNYIAIKADGKAKTKGNFLIPEKEYGSAPIFRFFKNPDCNIVNRAIVAYLKDGTPLETTIGECKDIREFLIVRSVTGGAMWTGEYVGKVVRWYYSRHSKASIHYQESGNLVPNSEGSRPLQELPATFPEDVDYAAYISLAQDELIELGAVEPETDELCLFSKEELDLLAAV